MLSFVKFPSLSALSPIRISPELHNLIAQHPKNMRTALDIVEGFYDVETQNV